MLNSRVMLLVAGLLTALSGVEPIVRISVPDAAQARRTALGSAWGAMWNDPRMLAWRHQGGPVTAAWEELLGSASQVRCELSVGEPLGGAPLLAFNLAGVSPGGAMPPATMAIAVQRVDAWVVGGSLAVPTDAPIGVEQMGGPGDPIVAGAAINARRLLAFLEGDMGIWSKALAACGIERGEVSIRLGATGLSERSSWPGGRLPVRAVDMRVLEGLPEKPLAMLLIGCDAPQAMTLLARVLEEDPAFRQAGQDLFGQDLLELLKACDGTIAWFLLPGPSGPVWVLSLPRQPAFDAVVAACLAAQAPEDAAALQEAIGQQPIAVAVPGLGTPLVQRSASRWILGSGAAQVAALAGEGGAPFPIDALCPDLLDGAGLAGFLDLGRVALPHFGPPPELFQALPAVSFSLAVQADRVVMEGRNALGLMLPAVALLPRLGPQWADAYRETCNRAAEGTVTQLVLRARAFATATSAHWPRDLGDLLAWAKELTPRGAAQAGRPDLAEPFCYVQPKPNPPADQPVIVQDPAVHRGAGSLVGFAGGEVRFIPGDMYWREARRLSALPATRSEGVEAQAWATMPRTF